MAEEDIPSHNPTVTMTEGEIRFSYTDPNRHERALFYFRPNQSPGPRRGPYVGTKWGNWSDALDAIAGFTANKAEINAFNFSVIGINPSKVGGYGKIAWLPEHIELVARHQDMNTISVQCQVCSIIRS